MAIWRLEFGIFLGAEVFPPENLNPWKYPMRKLRKRGNDKVPDLDLVDNRSIGRTANFPPTR